MTEFEKKQSRKIYDARDTELHPLQYRAKGLMKEYNCIPATRPSPHSADINSFSQVSDTF